MSIKKLLLLCAAVTPATLFAFSGEGVGTEKYPYLIKTADELFEIRNDLSANYKIMEDIDLTEFIQEESPSKGWAPIGNATTPFTGTLDGNNKTIKGLYINRLETDNVGLFGCVIAPATIKNLAIANANITGANYTGTLFGACLMGLLESNTAGCDIKDIVILDTNVIGKTGVGGIVGGIIFPENFNNYYNAPVNISGCWVSGSIFGESTVGGICG